MKEIKQLKISQQNSLEMPPWQTYFIDLAVSLYRKAGKWRAKGADRNGRNAAEGKGDVQVCLP